MADDDESAQSRYFAEPFVRDAEVASLIMAVERLFGRGAVVTAINQTIRAVGDQDRVEERLSTEAQFHDALKIELRRRLQPH